jgi:hypothetical protein
MRYINKLKSISKKEIRESLYYDDIKEQSTSYLAYLIDAGFIISYETLYDGIGLEYLTIAITKGEYLSFTWNDISNDLLPYLEMLNLTSEVGHVYMLYRFGSIEEKSYNRIRYNLKDLINDDVDPGEIIKVGVSVGKEAISRW